MGTDRAVACQGKGLDFRRELLKKRLAQNVSEATGQPHEFEYMFARPERRWRSDIAWPEVKVALEIDGGTWILGRHNRPSSSLKEMEKNNGYAERGWLVFHAPWKWIETGEIIPQIVRGIRVSLGKPE